MRTWYVKGKRGRGAACLMVAGSETENISVAISDMSFIIITTHFIDNFSATLYKIMITNYDCMLCTIKGKLHTRMEQVRPCLVGKKVPTLSVTSNLQSSDTCMKQLMQLKK